MFLVVSFVAELMSSIIFDGGYGGYRNFVVMDHVSLFFSERLGSERLLLRQKRVAKERPRKTKRPRKTPTNQRGLPVPFLYSCIHLLLFLSQVEIASTCCN